MGRPSYSSAYLHLAGRVGRLSPDASSSSSSSSSVSPRPGTVVSVCTTRGARELEGWVSQIGGQDLRALDGSLLIEDGKDGEEDEDEDDGEDTSEEDF